MGIRAQRALCAFADCQSSHNREPQGASRRNFLRITCIDDTASRKDLMIRFRCPSCRQKLNVALKLAGKSVACPKCGEQLQVPKDELVNQNPMSDQASENITPGPRNICRDDDPPVDNDFPDISEHLVPDEISVSLPAMIRSRKPTAKSSSEKKLRSTEMECLGCGKTMAKSDRYCVACGYNHFDAVETAVATQQKMHDRLEKQVGGLLMWQWLRLFSRFFR
jgi:ribosomal protein S27E